MPIDRTRRFSLPGIQDLSKDQEEALALPCEGQSLVIGGPGTGKSVVALLRARRLTQDQKNYTFLVYNHLLNQSNRHLFGDEELLTSRTWDKWFRDLWKQCFGQYVPTQEPQVNSKYRPIDWDTVIRLIHELPDAVDPLGGEPPFLIIDEGQDMPPKFYEALTNLGFSNFYVVADGNQLLGPDGSWPQDIEDELGIDSAETLKLKTNYRNSLPIATLALHFYPDDPASPRPDLPARKSLLTPVLMVYGNTPGRSLQKLAERILKQGDLDPRKLIGIITPNKRVLEKFRCALAEAEPALDNGKPPIQTYVSGQENTLDFGQGGIMIVNVQSCKGLEFDIVFLADIDQHQPKYDEKALKTLFYIMVTRAREQVFLLRSEDNCPVVDKLLPPLSSAILERK